MGVDRLTYPVVVLEVGCSYDHGRSLRLEKATIPSLIPKNNQSIVILSTAKNLSCKWFNPFTLPKVTRENYL